MKREHFILIIFLAIISLSGMAIYIYLNSHQTATKPMDTTSMNMPVGDSTKGMQMPPNENSPGGLTFDDMNSKGPDPKILQQQIDQLETHLKHDPNNFDVLVELGNNYFDINNPPKAIENYEKALKIQPNSPMVIVDCGSMYRQAGEPDKAIDLFNKAIQLDPKLPQAYYNLGMVMAMEKKNLKGAAEVWKKYLDLDPNSEMKDFIMQEINKANDQ